MKSAPDRNPYEVTRADVSSAERSAEVRRPTGLLIHAIINSCVSLLAAFAAGSVLRNFREMFAGFGAQVSAATQFVLVSAWLWRGLGLGGAALVIWVFRKPDPNGKELRRLKLAVRAFTVVFGLLLAFALYALYSAIFRLGAVV